MNAYTPNLSDCDYAAYKVELADQQEIENQLAAKQGREPTDLALQACKVRQQRRAAYLKAANWQPAVKQFKSYLDSKRL